MAKRIVRLTETDLRRIVKRVIKEDMGGMDDVHPTYGNLNLSKYSNDDLNDLEGGELSKSEVLDLISDYFKEEILPELTPEEFSMLERKVNEPNSGTMSERRIRENEDMPRRMGGRNAAFGEKAMMGGGAGLALSGAITALGNITGWSDFELTTKIHDFVEMAGVGNYGGPISIAMAAAGLALAFKGRARQYDRTGR
jgi:hypothetical protein